MTIQDLCNNWNSIEEINSIPKEITIIHCDTRDFYIKCDNINPKLFLNNIKQETKNNSYYLTDELIKVYNLKNTPLQYLINENEIIPFLKHIKAISGGDAEWRFLEANYDGLKGWDIKYIRFIRRTDTDFIVFNNRNYPIDYKQIEPNLMHNI